MLRINDVTKLRRDHALDLSTYDAGGSTEFGNAIDLSGEVVASIAPVGAIDLRRLSPGQNDFYEVMPAHESSSAFYPVDRYNADITPDREHGRRMVLIGLAVAVLALAMIASILAVRIKTTEFGLGGAAGSPAVVVSPTSSPSALPGVGTSGSGLTQP